jgi:2,4-dienoyl-CoA reductase-like NADH-dependent reductase (Old Yellow Enzyme family)
VRNRVRFVLETTSAVVTAVGADRVGMRLSPWSTF